MTSKQKSTLCGFYRKLSVKQRVAYMLDNYQNRDYYERGYRMHIEGMIADIRAYERNRNEELGVRIMSGASMSDITSAAAEEKIRIEKSFSENLITESLIKDKEDREMILMAIDEWLVIKDDYESLERVLWRLTPKEHDLFMRYSANEISYGDIAKEYMIEDASAKQKIHRIRSKILKMVEPEVVRHGLHWSKVAG